MAAITGVDHFGVTVSDVEHALAFWRDQLGLVEVGRGVIEWVELRIPSGGTVELSRYHRPVGAPVAPGEENEPGRSHISLLVDDLGSMLAALRADGVRARTDEPVDIPVGAYAGGKAAYVFDPDGVEVELIQRRGG